MNKKELLNAMKEKNGLSMKDNEVALKAFIDTVQETLAKEEKVQLIGFGTFETRERAARQGVNPKTKETIHIEACKAPCFKAGAEFKNRVNSAK